MPGREPPKNRDSGISDFDVDMKRKVRESRGSIPVPDSDDFTPITNIGDLGKGINAIKRGQDRTADALDNIDRVIQKDIKPKLNKVHDGFIRLETEHRATKNRLRILETDTKEVLTAPAVAHDCYHEDDIVDLKEGQRGVQAEIASVKVEVATVTTDQSSVKEVLDKNVKRIDGRSKMITGIAVTVVLFVLGIAGTAAAGFYTMQANVSTLSKEQTKIRTEVSGMGEAHVNASSKIQSAAERVEEVADQVEQNGHIPDPLEQIWCDLSPQERRRQERLRGSDKIPRRRCP